MNTTDFRNRRTLVPSPENSKEAAQFARLAAQFDAPSVGVPRLVGPDGAAMDIPHDIFAVLLQVAQSLASGQGVTVIPTDSQLTTQQAADFLGVSRPTLVAFLEEGAIPFSTVGRHRRVMLRDLTEYDARARTERRSSLAGIARASVLNGSLEATASQDHEMR
ncbi:excisionase family DNA-binding protein [Psychromicrobium xiongbiense]|uniref:excisionase family DNA-binding protein n=1 Tax=Psychromicrobium xiongbiense TaxID=3051184 RepID=UPI0025531506|nr:excisionase family DNA-binding protein [Psychromicrobium sp. YIM S02556]